MRESVREWFRKFMEGPILWLSQGSHVQYPNPHMLYQFESWLLHVQSSSLLMCLKKWGEWPKSLGLGFDGGGPGEVPVSWLSLTQPWELWPWWEGTSGWTTPLLSLSLSHSFKDIIFFNVLLGWTLYKRNKTCNSQVSVCLRVNIQKCLLNYIWNNWTNGCLIHTKYRCLSILQKVVWISYTYAHFQISTEVNKLVLEFLSH